MSGYPVFYLAPMDGGRRIVISTTTGTDELNELRPTKEAKLLIYDVEQSKSVKEFVPIKGARATGLIGEVAPGRLLGLTAEKIGTETNKHGYERPNVVGLLYGVDVNSGAVLFRKPLPWPVGPDPYWPHWIEAEEGAYFVCPDCTHKLTEDDRREMNRAAVLVHRGQEIDEKGKITGPLPPTRTLGFRCAFTVWRG